MAPRSPASERKSDTWIDPFAVIGKIPKGISYQWVAETVTGDDQITHFHNEKFRSGGWKPVPARRHPKMPRDKKGRIVVGGQVLLQRPARLTQAADEENNKHAREMAEGTPVGTSKRLPDKDDVWRSLGVSMGDGDVPHRIAELQKEVEEAGGAVKVDISIALTEREIEAAAICGLTAREYARRKIMMMPQCGIAGLIEVKPGTATFEFADLRVQKIGAE